MLSFQVYTPSKTRSDDIRESRRLRPSTASTLSNENMDPDQTLTTTTAYTQQRDPARTVTLKGKPQLVLYKTKE